MEGKREETVQAIHRMAVQATRIFGLLSCTRLPEVDMLRTGGQSVRPPAPSRPAAAQQATGLVRPRPTPTRPDEAGCSTRPCPPRPAEAGGSAWSQPRTPAASQYVGPPHHFAFHPQYTQYTQGANDVPYFHMDAFVRSMALGEGTPRLYLSARIAFFLFTNSILMCRRCFP